MTYHRFPSIRNGLVRAWRWLFEPSDQHTIIGRCACSYCELGRWGR